VELFEGRGCRGSGCGTVLLDLKFDLAYMLQRKIPTALPPAMSGHTSSRAQLERPPPSVIPVIPRKNRRETSTLHHCKLIPVIPF
jgi:hypothetical protein